MDVLYRLGRASAAEVRAGLADPPSYSAVRGVLRSLEDKALVRHEQDGVRYLYLPTVEARKARRSALRHIVRTFFRGSAEQAAAALIEDAKLSGAELDRLAAIVEKARREGK